MTPADGLRFRDRLRGMPGRRWLALGLVLSLLHLALTAWLIGQVPIKRPPTLFERLSMTLLTVMHLPAYAAERLSRSGDLMIVLMPVDSALWGFGIAWLIARVRRHLVGRTDGRVL